MDLLQRILLLNYLFVFVLRARIRFTELPDGTKEIKFPLGERRDTVCDLDTETESIFAPLR